MLLSKSKHQQSKREAAINSNRDTSRCRSLVRLQPRRKPPRNNLFSILSQLRRSLKPRERRAEAER